MKILIIEDRVFIFVNNSFISMSYDTYRRNWKIGSQDSNN